MGHRISRLGSTVSVLMIAFAVHVAVPGTSAAQSIAGEYQVEVRGTTYYLDREPEQRALQDNTTLVVTQQGDVIELEFRTFASAMATTIFRGRVGHGRFVALWSHSTRPGEALTITGEVDGRRLRGRLIYPRATADAGVPGWTEVEFSAVRRATRVGQAGSSGIRGALPGRLPGRAPAQSTATAQAEQPFEVEMSAFTEPGAPLAGHRIEFVARGTPSARGESVGQMELWVNGLVQGSSDGNLLEVMAGPFEAGRLSYDVVAVSTDGHRSEPSTHTVMISAAGGTTIHGRLDGASKMISDVQLVRMDGTTVAASVPDANGRYRIAGVPAGDYLIFVNDAKSEARVSPSSNLEIAVDGSSTYERNFEVR